MFYLATLTWTKEETKGESPPKRGGHCTFLAHNRMYIFGGYDGKKYYNDLYCLSLGKFIKVFGSFIHTYVFFSWQIHSRGAKSTQQGESPKLEAVTLPH